MDGKYGKADVRVIMDVFFGGLRVSEESEAGFRREAVDFRDLWKEAIVAMKEEDIKDCEVVRRPRENGRMED